MLVGRSTSFVSSETTTLSRSPDNDLSMCSSLISVYGAIWASHPCPGVPISVARMEGLVIQSATTSTPLITAVPKIIFPIPLPLVEGKGLAPWAVRLLKLERHPMGRGTRNLVPERWNLPTPFG
jgi:hypothetical protein